MIEKLTINDIKETAILAKGIHDSSKYSKMSFNYNNYEEIYKRWLTDSNVIMICIRNENKVIIAFFMGYLEQYLFTNDGLIAKDGVLYVHEDYQDSNVFSELINEYVKWAKEKQVKCICLNHVCNLNKKKIGKAIKELEFQSCSRLTKKE